MKTAVIAGSTGLVGSELLQLCLQSDQYSQVLILVRKLQADLQHPKLIQLQIDWDSELKIPQQYQSADWFCCLGTTIKKAKSKEAFRKVDHDYVIHFAQLAKKLEANTFVFVSAMGADSNSSIFYNQTKGQVESELQNLGLKQLKIVRPSLLLGDRKEYRPGEKIATVLSPLLSILMIGEMKKYKPIQAKAVARAMLALANIKNETGVIIESLQCQVLADNES